MKLTAEFSQIEQSSILSLWPFNVSVHIRVGEAFLTEKLTRGMRALCGNVKFSVVSCCLALQ